MKNAGALLGPSRGENTLAKGIEERFMGEQTVDVSLDIIRTHIEKWGI